MSTTSKHLKIRSSKLMNSLFLGNFKAVFHGKGIEFRDFREYSSSDDAKYIDWVRSSTEGTTIMRRYREEKEGNILCVMDLRETLNFPDGKEKLHTMNSIVELLGNAALSSGESFGGYISAATLSYVKPKKNRLALSELKKVTKDLRTQEIPIDLKFLLERSLKRSIVFLISDNLSYDKEVFKSVAHKHDIIYVYVGSDFEERLEGRGVQYLKSSLLGVAVDFDDSEKKNKYIKERKKLLAEFQKSLKKIGIDSVTLTETSSIVLEFLKLMQLRTKI